MRRFVLLSLLLIAGFARAEDERSPAAVEARDEQISVRAKHRDYPGGADESDLKVQNPMPTPVRKIAPTLEEAEGAGGED